MKDIHPNTLEVCLSPALFPYLSTQEPFVVVVVDILRATSSLCAAFSTGLKSVIPVAGLQEAKSYKAKGFPVAAERDGHILDFADYGNSPLEYLQADLKGQTLVYCTTNGTGAITLAKDAAALVIGGFVNLDVLADWLLKQQRNVVILCSGWKNQFALEDTVFAGALSEKLLETPAFVSQSDAVVASLELWHKAKPDLLGFHSKASHPQRLVDIGQDASIPYCFTLNVCNTLPGLRNGLLVDFLKDG